MAEHHLVASTEEQLLREALDSVLPGDTLAVTPVSREPLGDGSVCGFEVSTSELPTPLLYYVDTSGVQVTTETGLALRDDSGKVSTRVWLHPADPHLPALAPAAFGDTAAALLSRLGMPVADEPEIVRYRPGRRGVLRMPLRRGAVWVKVVRPRRLAALLDRHERLRTAGIPTPGVHGWSPEGLIVVDDALGAPAAHAAGQLAELLSAIDELRDRLAGIDLARPASGSSATRLIWYRERLDETLDVDRARRARGLATTAGALIADMPSPAAQTIHGDLHLGQLFTRRENGRPLSISSVIDLDTAGTGDPAEDSAVFITHTVVSALMTAENDGDPATMWDLAHTALDRWNGAPGLRPLLACRMLGHVLSAATRGDERRVDALLDVAGRVLAGQSLTAREG